MFSYISEGEPGEYGFLPAGVYEGKIVKMEEEMKKSFIAYAMAVNVSRAIPDVRDGASLPDRLERPGLENRPVRQKRNREGI